METGYFLQTTGFQNPRNGGGEECFFLPNAGFSSCWSFGGIQTGRGCETMSPSFVTDDVGSHIGGHSNPLVPYSNHFLNFCRLSLNLSLDLFLALLCVLFGMFK